MPQPNPPREVPEKLYYMFVRVVNPKTAGGEILLAEIISALSQARDEALEEAAKWCETFAEQYDTDGYEAHGDEARRMAAKIRSLKSPRDGGRT